MSDEERQQRRQRRSAMVSWVGSSLQFENEETILAVKEALRAVPLMALERLMEEEDYLHRTLSKATKEDCFALALGVKAELNDFELLDGLEESGYYRNALLPQSLLKRHGLDDYIQGAIESGRSEGTQDLLNFLLGQQEVVPEEAEIEVEFPEMQEEVDVEWPNCYICIIASSGTGKTQLVATASLTFEGVKTIYLNMGQDSDQSFYRPHDSKPLMETITKFIEMIDRKAITLSANGIAQWAKKQDKGHSTFVRLLYHLLTGKPFRRDDVKCVLKLRDLKAAMQGEKFLVFLDEVPPMGNDGHSKCALCLRDTLRHLGIAPILMSTHTGAQDYVGATSRKSIDAWTWIVSALPKCAPFPGLDRPPLFWRDTERPWTLAKAKAKIIKGDGSLLECVGIIRRALQQCKSHAWTESSDLQLAQLFETDVEIKGDWFTSAHKLVGHHFGWLVQGSDDGRASYKCIEASNYGKQLEVAPVCARTEPLLYLALVTWTEAMLEENTDPLFPLIDGLKKPHKPLTMRGAFMRCQDLFNSKLSTENEHATKSDGNLLEVLVHAALTLALMKVYKKDDSLCLGGMSLKEFLPLVRAFLFEEFFKTVPTAPSFFNELKFVWPDVPALGGSNSGLPKELADLPNVSIGFLDRPADNKMVDGRMHNMHSPKTTNNPFLVVECKNYRSGVDASLLKDVFKHINHRVECSMVFVSFLKENILSRQSVAKIREECFGPPHNKDGVSVVYWENNKEPAFLKVKGGEAFKAKNKTSLLIVIVAVGTL